MTLKEFIKRFQGKYYSFTEPNCITRMKIVKVIEEKFKEKNYAIICDYINYIISLDIFTVNTHKSRFKELVSPEEIGWEKITKSEYDMTKKKAEYKQQLEYGR